MMSNEQVTANCQQLSDSCVCVCVCASSIVDNRLSQLTVVYIQQTD